MSDPVEAFEHPATVYFDRSNNFVAVVMDSNPKKKFTATHWQQYFIPNETSTTTDLERNPNQGSPKRMKFIVPDLNRLPGETSIPDLNHLPGETSTDGKRSTPGDDKGTNCLSKLVD
ncbi:hypothetical protein FRC08_015665 [Ceratobasidium sp. 394]|nr:hypothetical protein FRC08_015665 [Ceratobasidium sp. 394]